MHETQADSSAKMSKYAFVLLILVAVQGVLSYPYQLPSYEDLFGRKLSEGPRLCLPQPTCPQPICEPPPRQICLPPPPQPRPVCLPPPPQPRPVCLPPPPQPRPVCLPPPPQPRPVCLPPPPQSCWRPSPGVSVYPRPVYQKVKIRPQSACLPQPPSCYNLFEILPPSLKCSKPRPRCPVIYY